jgi:hypothetical protein
MSAEDRQAIRERTELIEARAFALVAAAVDAGAAWARRLGRPPIDPKDHTSWVLAAATVAAYRDRYKIESDLPVGGGGAHDAQRADRRRARWAAREAQRLAAETGTHRRLATHAHAISVP